MAAKNAVRSNVSNLKVLFEDNHLIVVNKRPSDIVQGDRTGDQPLSDVVAEYIAKKYNKPGKAFIGVIHRLDRPVSGVVVFARTGKALTRMNNIFRDKQVQKTYWAVTEEAPEQPKATLVDMLQRNTTKNKSFVTLTKAEDAKRSELSYEVKGKGDRYHFIEVKPLTGRHHQIRVQLAHAGAIIKGDLKYGASRSNKDASIHLHARMIEFEHPVSKEPIKVVADPSKEDALWSAFLAL